LVSALVLRIVVGMGLSVLCCGVSAGHIFVTGFCNYILVTNTTEYMKIVKAVGAGFLVMGAIGYAVKLVSLRGPEFCKSKLKVAY
jgi:hypothetical protein